MTQQITCQGCGATLAVQDAGDTNVLSCPRCLAPLGLTSTAIRENASLSTGVTESAPQVPRPMGAWARGGMNVDQEADKDSKRGFHVLSILIGLNILGIVLTIAAPKNENRGINNLGAVLLIALLFGILDLLVIIQIGILLYQWSSRSSPLNLGAAFLKGVAMTFAFLGLALAVIVFFFFACLGVTSRW
jgi:hypothetical protein